jgi:YbbR domain-containing protein
MRKLLLNNWQLKLLSLVLAFLFSSYIYRFGEYQVTASLVMPVEVRNLSSELAFLDEPKDAVGLSIAGNLQQINSLKKMDLRAVLDLKGINSPGVYTIQLELPDLPELRVAGAFPSLQVRLTKKASITLPIEVTHRGELPEGYVLSGEGLSPTKAEVVGPEELVKKAKYIVATINLSGHYTRISQSVELAAYAEDYEPMSRSIISVSPPMARYTADVSAVANVRVVSVRPDLTGGDPKPGYYVKEVTITPAQVLFPTEVYRAHPLKYVTTGPVGLAGRDKSFAVDVPIEYGFKTPEGLPDKVQVRVVLAKLEAQEDEVINAAVVLSNTNEAYQYVAQPPTVVVQSPELPGLSVVERAQIDVRVDVAGLKPGVYRLVPLVLLPAGIHEFLVIPEVIEVSVQEKG